MIIETRESVRERRVYGPEDLPGILSAKARFIEAYAEAKAKAKADPEDRDAKVDSCYWRVLIRKMNRMIYIIRKKGEYAEETNSQTKTDAREETFDAWHPDLRNEEVIADV